MAGNLFPIGRVRFGVEPVGRFLFGQRRERLDDKVPRNLSGDAAHVALEHPLRLAGQRCAVDRWPCQRLIISQVGAQMNLIRGLSSTLYLLGSEAERLCHADETREWDYLRFSVRRRV